jgi:hypothetical protein
MGHAMIVETVLGKVGEGLTNSLIALNTEAGASPVLLAVVEEFYRKLAKTQDAILGSDERLAREGLIELEQAADSARYAALADKGVAAATRDLIVETHDWVCIYKQTGQLMRPVE